MSCEDEVSYCLYSYFLKSEFTILHWHPPGGKKYFTGHLRIPIYEGNIRKGRYLVDLILSNEEMLILTECKCYLSESDDDIQKLRKIRDDVGLEQLKMLFSRQGATIPKSVNQLILSLGVRSIDCTIPDDFLVFKAEASEIKVTMHKEKTIQVPSSLKSCFK